MSEMVFEPLNDMAIHRLFLYRCVMCNKVSTEINHIIPRSRGKEYVSDWRNKVPMCHWCHEEYHAGGVTEEKIKLLQQRRAEYLVMIGKSTYV